MQLAALMDLGFHAQQAQLVCDGVSPLEVLIERLLHADDSPSAHGDCVSAEEWHDETFPGGAAAAGDGRRRFGGSVLRRFSLRRSSSSSSPAS
jgi:hypothetical protein